jgi:dipeptidase E
MKLLLTSSGFTSNSIIDKCTELVGKDASEISLAVINEGYAVEAGDHSWVIDELATLRSTFGGIIEIVNLLALDKETVRDRLSFVDVVYVVGGNTDYLMHVFKKTGFDKILTELLKTKVYVGSSAGSMVICKRISTESYQSIYGEGDTFSIDSYLELVDIAIKPHLNSPEWPNNRAENLKSVSKDYTGTMYALSDKAAITVKDNALEVIGEDWLKFKSGEMIV